MKAIFKSGIELRVNAKIVSKLKHYIYASGMNKESGGILIGTQSVDGKTYEVTDVTFPTTNDKRHRLSFLRSRIAANKEIHAAWKRSRGKENYLGEWHTHNEPNPRPSRMDKRAAKYLAEHGPHPFGHTFLFIFGNSDKAFIGMIDSQGKTLLEEGIHS